MTGTRRATLAAVFLLIAIQAVHAAETPLTESLPVDRAPYSRCCIGGASNGDGALVAWSDSRGTRGERYSSLYAQRLDAQARPVGDNILVFRDDSVAFIQTPQVAWNGSDYLIAFTLKTYRIDGLETEEFQVRFARIARDGEVTLLDGSIPHAFSSALSWLGESFVLSYSDTYPYFGNPPTLIAVLDRNGSMLRSNLRFTTDRAENLRFVRSPSGDVVATWIARNEGAVRTAVVRAADLLAVGFPPISSGLIGNDVGRFPHRVATDGSSILVVWNAIDDRRQTSTFFAQPFGFDGKPLGAASVVGFSTWNNTSLALAWNGHEYVLLFDAAVTSGMTAVRISDTGRLTDTQPLAPSNGFPTEILATTAGAVPLYAMFSDEVRAQLIPAGATKATGDEVMLARSVPDQYSPFIAACGDGSFAVVWGEAQANTRRVFYRVGSGTCPVWP